MIYFIKGFGFGFFLASIVGPISLLCIRKTLMRGRLSGFASGLGAAFADAIYSIVALLGIGFISQFLIAHKSFFSLLGGAALCVLGLRAFFSHKSEQCPLVTAGSLLKDFFGTMMLTFTNPLTVLTFLGFFAGLGLHEEGFSFFLMIEVVFGVFLGASLWWAFLAFLVGFARDAFAQKWISRLSKVSGIAIFVFGVSFLISAAARFVHIF